MSPGKRAITFQQLNTGYGAIPSVDTLRENIKKIVGEPLRECGFTQHRLDYALKFFREKIGYKLDVFLLVWDATALLPALGYDSTTDGVQGLAIPDELLCQFDVRAGESLEEFLRRFHSFKLATQVEILLLVPLAPHYPPYILAAFAQSGSQKMETIERRMAIAREEMERRGALILGPAADGASGNFALMRKLRQLLPSAPSIDILSVPTLHSDGNTIHLPARRVCFKGKQLLVPQLPILDPVHLAALFRNAALRLNAKLTVGDYDISLVRVRDFLLKKLGTAFNVESQLGVRHSDFAVVDRMNFASVQRLFSNKMLAYLEQHCTDAIYRGAMLSRSLLLTNSNR